MINAFHHFGVEVAAIIDSVGSTTRKGAIVYFISIAKSRKITNQEAGNNFSFHADNCS